MGILTAIVGRYVDSEKSSSPVQFEPERCSAVNGQCGSLCVQACLNNAISPEKKYVDYRKCHGCGSCTSRCPNGGIHLVGYPDHELVGDMVYTAKGKKVIRFYCDQNSGGKFNAQPQSALGEIKVRCLARLYPGLLLYSLTTGMDQTWLDISGCDSCPDNRDGRLFEQIGSYIDQAQQILRCLGLNETTLFMESDLPADLRARLKIEKNLDRRDFFNYVRQEIRDYSRKMVVDFMGNDNGQKAGPGRPEKKPPLSRLILHAAVRKLDQGRAIERSMPGTMIRIEKKCSLCGICSGCCPTGALRQEKQEVEMTGELFFRPAYCINCGICREKCPRKVISFQDRMDLTVFCSGSETRVFATELTSCKKCKASYVQDLGENGLCDICSHKASVL